MTRVDFYISTIDKHDNELVTACRLADKAYKQGNRIYIHTNDKQQAEQVDDLLWTFRDGSFIPHCMDKDTDADDHPVVIGHGDSPSEVRDVLINLSADVPTFFSRFERVAEVVNGKAELREASRERFRFYKERGYELNTHEIKD